MIATESEVLNRVQFFTPENPAYECRAVLVPEDNGFSIYASRLPGVFSQGDTADEAITNIAEAFRGVIESYHARKVKIPWQDANVDPAGKEVWILVDG